ncbi:MAG TPA: O-antigen ligase family protein [Rhodanobacteraceae bacterium]
MQAVFTRRNIAHAVALAAIMFAAATCMLSGFPTKPEYGIALAALLLPFAGRETWSGLLAHPYCKVLAAFIVFALVQTLYLHAAGYGSLQHLSASTSKPVKLGIFAAIVGAWFARYPAAAWAALGLMLAGLVFQTITGIVDTGLAPLFVDHVRLAIGYPTNLGAMLLGAAAIGTTLLTLHVYRHTRNAARGWLLAGGAAVTAFLLLSLVLTGSRGPWLATLVGLAATVYVHFRRSRADGTQGRPTTARPLLLLLAVLIPLVALGLYRVALAGRLSGLRQITDAVLTDHSAQIPMSSVGMRLHLLGLGRDAFLHHPVMGIGLASIDPLIKGSGIRNGAFIPGHLHDIYMQALTGFGAIGFVLLLLGGVILARGVTGARFNDRRHALLQLIVAGAAIVVLIENLTDCLVWRLVHARIPLELLLGCAVALSLQAARARSRSHDRPHAGAAVQSAEARDGGL